MRMSRCNNHRIESLEARRMLALTHLYTFNDGTFNDSVGTAHGTLFNGAAINSGRLQLQNAGVTSGSASVKYGKLPNGVLPASGSATIEIWYNTFSATPNWMRVFDFGDGSASANSFLFYTPKTDGNIARATLKPSGTSTERRASDTVAQNQGYFHTATIVVDSTAGQLLLYVDGALKGSAALSGSTIASINEVNAYIGRSQFTADAGFSGSIDEFRIYDTALDAAAVAARYAEGVVPLPPTQYARQLEKLDRGMVGVYKGGGQVYLSWRLFGNDDAGTSFNLYRVTGNAAASKRNGAPISLTTDFTDTGVDTKQVNQYYIRPVINGVEGAPSEPFILPTNPGTQQYLSIPLQKPPGGLTVDGVAFNYVNFEASVGDLDGDGQYEIITSWYGETVATSVYFPPMIVDAYEMDGTLLWRINRGLNITDAIDNFLVYDLDGDGKAEVVMRTADGTVSGTGQVIGDANAFYQNDANTYPAGWTVHAPNWLTVFNGATGAAMSTVPHEPPFGSFQQWGDNYGQRSKQYYANVAYLDGVHPSLVTIRGIYYNQASYPQAQTQIVAWDFANGTLTKRWHFKAGKGINNDIHSNFVGQGNHQTSVADVDGDGKDEIINGSMVVDDNGMGLVSSQLEHGDALHVTDLDPSRPGVEVFGIHENEGTYDPNRPAGAAMFDPRTGVTMWGAGKGIDVGRGNAADVDPTRPGMENWGGPPIDNPQGAGVIRDVNGQTITDGLGTPLPVPSTNNFLIWWDADLTRELLDRSYINKWDWTDGSSDRLMTASFVSTNQGTKQFPALSGDLIGDWREEVMWRASDSSELRIYTTTIPATNRIYTLMHDSQYRQSIAWQNYGYNQPPHTSFFLGAGMANAPTPLMYTPVSGDAVPATPTGVSVRAVSLTEAQIMWNAVPGATHYRIKRASNVGGKFVTIAADVTGDAYIDRTIQQGGVYFYVVSALNVARESTNSQEVSVTTSLPLPWTPMDIGTVAFVGRNTYSGGVFSIRGAGASSGDGLRMLSQSLSGDGEMITRIDSKDNRIGYAGLMYRKSTAASAAYAAIWAAPTDNDRIFFHYRQNDGGGTSYSVAYSALPVWLKLTRVANTFTGFHSADGITWTQVGTRGITMGTTIPAGLVVSGSANDSTTGNFSNVAISHLVAGSPTVSANPLLFETDPLTFDLQFSEDVGATLDAGDFAVTLLGTGIVTPTFAYDANLQRARLSFTSPAADGNYRVTVNSAGVQDVAGNSLIGTNTFDFFFLNGDMNRDRKVNTQDFNLLAANFGGAERVFSQGDLNFNGLVDSTDFNLFLSQYGKSLPLPAAALAAGASVFSATNTTTDAALLEELN